METQTQQQTSHNKSHQTPNNLGSFCPIALFETSKKNHAFNIIPTSSPKNSIVFGNRQSLQVGALGGVLRYKLSRKFLNMVAY